MVGRNEENMGHLRNFLNRIFRRGDFTQKISRAEKRRIWKKTWPKIRDLDKKS